MIGRFKFTPSCCCGGEKYTCGDMYGLQRIVSSEVGGMTDYFSRLNSVVGYHKDVAYQILRYVTLPGNAISGQASYVSKSGHYNTDGSLSSNIITAQSQPSDGVTEYLTGSFQNCTPVSAPALNFLTYSKDEYYYMGFDRIRNPDAVVPAVARIRFLQNYSVVLQSNVYRLRIPISYGLFNTADISTSKFNSPYCGRIVQSIAFNACQYSIAPLCLANNIDASYTYRGTTWTEQDLISTSYYYDTVTGQIYNSSYPYSLPTVYETLDNTIDTASIDTSGILDLPVLLEIYIASRNIPESYYQNLASQLVSIGMVDPLLPTPEKTSGMRSIDLYRSLFFLRYEAIAKYVNL